MKKIISLVIFFMFVGHAIHSAVFFDAKELSSTGGSWHLTSGRFNGEYFQDYWYRGQIVFRVLKRLKPSMDSLILYAKDSKGFLRLADPTIVIFTSDTAIKKNFSVNASNSDKTILDPGVIQFDISSGDLFNKKKYSLRFSTDAAWIPVKKEVFFMVITVANAATVKKQSVAIDLSALGKHKNTCMNFISLAPTEVVTPIAAPEIAEHKLCTVCLENEKNILLEPCNHVCLCENCAAQIDKLCPICRAEFTTQKKIYF